ncbi:CRISPR-associated endonuclease Cas9 REC1/REC2 domain-containing protein [Allobaculum sp. Allo2]|uniref:CRISPR-associated endonuclease Cas9 REC1/REC2 domain-containing protein n=1 Tax=Allobaculum sp. Allo2 TaxID=2853432 RepID=UPI001F620B0F|nr:CRISPR-associated endonuclease Cas9 REC1/REC2 domain-containing protein [Allobaculum sp. Allo2]UNT93857.1 hypothetical protein KWG61_03840 [Allobaculum sp. Allo2]
MTPKEQWRKKLSTGPLFTKRAVPFEKAICSEFPELTPKQIKRILGNRFNGWGRCSREFLEMEGTDSQGNESTVMGFLWSTNDNLMQVLSDKYSFRKTIAENAAKEQKSLFEISHEDLDGLYLSGPVKRMIWQTIRILREITGLMGKAPKKCLSKWRGRVRKKESGQYPERIDSKSCISRLKMIPITGFQKLKTWKRVCFKEKGLSLSDSAGTRCLHWSAN